MRRILGFIVGVAMIVGGAWGFLYMFLFAVEPVKLFVWLIPATVFGVGVAIVLEDVLEFLKRGRA